MVPPIRVPVAMAVVAAATVSAVAAWCTLAGRKPWWRPATWRWVFGSAPPPLLATSFCSDVYYVFRHPSPSAAVEVELDVLRVKLRPPGVRRSSVGCAQPDPCPAPKPGDLLVTAVVSVQATMVDLVNVLTLEPTIAIVGTGAMD